MIAPEEWRKVDALFEGALELAPAERAGWLKRACPDPERRDRVEALLQAADQARHFLRDRTMIDQGLAEALGIAEEASQAAAEALDRVGDRLGPYLLREQIGRGGMATVYAAVRVEGGFEQRVAVKVIRRGLDTDDVVRRFEAERNILSSLHHPGISRLLDGGATPDGLPYLVMEHVDGLPVTTFCDRRGLGLAARLRLFLEIAEAVSFAHRSLVVHRDLKPSNILVTDEGRVMLLDFGIAKLLSDDPEADGATRTGRRWLTPGHAAPEQVVGGAITTATDVYQLGLLLYELLTGWKPFPVQGRSPLELERAIQEEDPPLPSRVVARPPTAPHTGESALAAPRGVMPGMADPASLQRALEGDLDAILMKALRKAPEERYGSVDALAADIRRHRASKPVEARLGGRLYRARKFIRRNRGAVASAAAIVLLLLGYAVTATILGAQVAEERDRARRETEKATRVTDFLTSILAAGDPRQAQGDTVTVGEVLGVGAERAEEELADQPDVQAELYYTIGSAYRQLGELARADTLLSRALDIRESLYGPEPSDELSEVQTELAYLRMDLGQFDSAERIMRTALAQRLALHPEGEESIADDMVALAETLRVQRRHDEAEALYEDALAIYEGLPDPPRPSIAIARNNLGLLYHQTERLQLAGPLYEQAVEILVDTLGERHPWTLSLLHNLAAFQRSVGRYAVADSLFDILVSMESEVAPETPNAAAGLANQAMTRWLRGRYDAADTGYVRALEILEAALPPDHPAITLRMLNLAELRMDQGRHDDAIAILQDMQRRRVQRAGPEGATRATQYIGVALRRAGRYEAAQQALEEALRARRQQLDAPDAQLAIALEELAFLHRGRGDLTAAGDRLREALAVRRAVEGGERGLAETLTRLAGILRAQGSLPAARAALDEARTIVAGSLPPDGVYSAMIELEQARLQLAEGDPQGALDGVDRLEPWFARQYTEDHYRRGELGAVRGEALVALGRLDEAEAVLLASDAILSRRSPAERLASAQRLVSLYEAWGRVAEAARYRARAAGRGLLAAEARQP